jgi:hypothetical protein
MSLVTTLSTLKKHWRSLTIFESSDTVCHFRLGMYLASQYANHTLFEYQPRGTITVYIAKTLGAPPQSQFLAPSWCGRQSFCLLNFEVCASGITPVLLFVKVASLTILA